MAMRGMWDCDCGDVVPLGRRCSYCGHEQRGQEEEPKRPRKWSSDKPLLKTQSFSEYMREKYPFWDRPEG
jgi:hypothetical protein